MSPRFWSKLKKTGIVMFAVFIVMAVAVGILEYRSNPIVQVSSLIDLKIPRGSSVLEQKNMMGGLPVEGEVFYLIRIPEDKMTTLIDDAIKKDWQRYDTNIQNVLKNTLVDPRVPPVPSIDNGIYVIKNINTRKTN